MFQLYGNYMFTRRISFLFSSMLNCFFLFFLSYVCITQLCDKCYDFGVIARFQSQRHNTYHVTALYKHMKEKTTALQA